MKKYSKQTLADMTPAVFTLDVLAYELTRQKDPDGAVSTKLQEAIAFQEVQKQATMSYPMMANLFRAWEKVSGSHLEGYITFTRESYPIKNSSYAERTFRVCSDCSAFHNRTVGNEVIGYSLSCPDAPVSLHEVMAAHLGGSRGWLVEYCFLAGDLAPC